MGAQIKSGVESVEVPNMWKTQSDRSVLYGECCRISQRYFFKLLSVAFAVVGRALTWRKKDLLTEDLDVLTSWTYSTATVCQSIMQNWLLFSKEETQTTVAHGGRTNMWASPSQHWQCLGLAGWRERQMLPLHALVLGFDVQWWHHLSPPATTRWINCGLLSYWMRCCSLRDVHCVM